jgi:F0F1-type ATP synthase membrane subunit c/vacuolar-type H+-ATPase subunit K
MALIAASVLTMEISARDAVVDEDNDGMDDDWEIQYGLNITTNDSALDPDNDGLSNIEEWNGDTNPVDVYDMDNDWMNDSWEGRYGLDNTTDDSELDFDNDGLTNIQEWEGHTDPTDDSDPPVKENRILVMIGVAIAMGLAAIMSSIGIGIAGSAAAGVAAERPDKFGKLIIYQALPMTQGIYGLLIAILVLNFTGLTEPSIEILKGPFVGWAAIAIGIVIGLSSVSAIPQGMTASAAAAAFGRNNTVFGRGVIFTVMSETMAIFGFLVAIFLLLASGMLG